MGLPGSARSNGRFVPAAPSSEGHPLFLSGGGKMGASIRDHAWEATMLGAPRNWARSLQTLVEVMLAAGQPMFIAWGPDRLLLFNDGYAPILGDRCAGAVGKPFFEVWPEVEEALEPLFDRVFDGEPVHMDDITLRLDRPGRPAEAHFAFFYTPVRDEDGAIVGLFCPCTETTEQVFAARRHAEERERLAQLFEQAPSFMAVLQGPDHRIELINPGYARLIGHRHVLGKTIAEALPDAVEQGYLDLLDGVFRSGKAFAAAGSKYAMQSFPGGPVDERFVDFVFQPITDAEGTVTGIFVEGVDVTARAEADNALRASEAEAQSVFEGMGEGFILLGPDFRIRRINAAGLRMDGRGRDDIVGSHLLDAWPDVEGLPNWPMYQDAMRDRRKAELTFSLGPEPRSPWIEVRAFPSGDGLAIFYRDVTETMRAEVALREMNEKLEAIVEERTAERNVLAKIVETTDAFIMVVGLDYDILAINKANADEFERIHGVRPKAGDNLLGIIADQPEHRAQIQAGWGRALAGEAFTIVEAFGDPERDRPYYEIKFNVLRNEAGERVGAYNFVYDVTQRLRDQARLAGAEEALRQSQKMEAVGQLTGGLAHDFNNLLTGISGSIEMMQTRVAQGRLNDLERYIVAAQGASKRAAALTHRLLAFSRRQTLAPKTTDVARLVVDMADLIRRTVGPGITVETVNVVGLWNALVDPNQLENALLNLCINSRDAMPDGGRLTIETGNRWMDERTARERDLAPGQYLSLCVSDTGTGMTPEVIARAFDPFFTTKPIGLGTGLGLSMIYGFARQSGGQVRIYSEAGEGAMVCLYLPRHVGGESDAVGNVESPDVPRAREGETVLVVDDEPTVRMLVTDVLEDLGYRALEAGDGASGLKVLQSDARIDLLVTDVGLPGGMNGRQVADAARGVRPGLKVLFITGYAENAVLSNGHLDPGMHVLTKPFDMSVLAGRIKELLAG